MKSYLKFLSRNKLYTAIEAAGLIVSLAFVLLTGHYVWKQRQMTRNVPDYQDVYSFYRSTNGNSGIGQSWGLAYQAKESIPEVEKSAMFWRALAPEENTVEINGSKHHVREFMVGGDFFDIFPAVFESGDAGVMGDISNVIISRSFANRLGGEDKAIGSIIDGRYTIAAIIRETPNPIFGDVDVIYNKVKVRGNVLFSHVGLTGPGIINLSNDISKSLNYNLLENDPNFDLEIAIDLCPAFTREELKERFADDFQLKGKTMIKNYMKLFLTKNFIDYFLSEIDLDGETQLSRVNKKSRNLMIEKLKRFTFEITGFNEALSKVTIGGVNVINVNPKTMASTLIPNLYFAGEVLDLHGPTGGYNLKIAFSTGYLAGLSASEK